MSNNPFPLEDGDPGTPFYGAHADRDGSESKTKELHSYLAAVVDWPEDAVQEVERLRLAGRLLAARAERAEAEVMRYQSGSAYEVGYDHGSATAGLFKARAERAESNARGKQAVIEAQRATLDRVRAALVALPVLAQPLVGQLADILAILDADPAPEADAFTLRNADVEVWTEAPE